MALEDKENAEQTEKLADMKFLAKMSNKMSTPINVILGNNDMILRGTRESHTAAYAIGIQAAGKSLSLAVSNIIELMNLDNGTGVQHLNKEKIAAGPIKPVFFCQILQIICCMCCMFMI